jgi:aerobic C4-dicarboxylate transport protein
MALILGIDRFMSEARALVNMIGNGVATVVMARWEGELDQARMDAVLRGHARDDHPVTVQAAEPITPRSAPSPVEQVA